MVVHGKAIEIHENSMGKAIVHVRPVMHSI